MPLTEKDRSRGLEAAIAWKRKDSADKEFMIRELLARGMSQSQIARNLGMKRQSVHRIIKRIKG